MNIKEELRRIEQTYHLVMEGESYQDKIRKTVEIILNELPKDSKIGIKGAGVHTMELLSLNHHLNVVGIFDKSYQNADTKEYTGKKYMVYPEEEIPHMSMDIMIISSYAHRKGIAEELQVYQGQFQVIDIYDELRKHNLDVNEAFYRNTEDMYENVLYYRQNYYKNKNKFNLKNLIIAYLKICNFVNYEKYSKKYIEKQYEDSGQIAQALTEVKNMWATVKEVVGKRKQKDIIMIWNDQMGYKDLQYAPYMSKLAEHSLFFENAYAVAPFTYPSLMGIFRKLRAIDDNIYLRANEGINIDNSTLLKMLDDYGYYFLYIGNIGNGRLFNEENRITRSAYSSSNLHFIDLYQTLLDSSKPVFSIVHVSVETHNPYLSGELDHAKWYDWPRFCGDTEEMALEQMKKSLAYWDKQVEYYTQFFHENMVQIYMSDHGKRYNVQPVYCEDTMHITFFLIGKNVPKERYTKMFSLINLDNVVQAINDNRYIEEQITTEYVFMQEVNVFTKATIMYYIEKNNVELSYSFRCVKTTNETLIKLSNGKSYYFVNGNNNNCIKTEKYKLRINYLNKILGNFFKNSDNEIEKLTFYKKKYDNHE